MEPSQPIDDLPVPAGFSPQAVLARYINGERTEDIALAFGLKRGQLVHWLVKTSEEDWKTAQLLRAIKRKEEAEDTIDKASDQFTLNRATAQLKSAQWDLERVCSRIYGETKQTPITTPVQININLRRDERSV